VALEALKLFNEEVDEVSELSFVQELNKQRHAKAMLLKLIVFIVGSVYELINRLTDFQRMGESVVKMQPIMLHIS